MRKYYIKCVIDAVILYLVLRFIQDYVLSQYFGASKVRDILIFFGAIAIMAMSFFFGIYQQNNLKMLIKGAGINILAFLISVIVGFFLRMLVPLRFFSVYNDTDFIGFVIVFVDALYLTCTLIIRIFLTIIRVIIIRKRNKSDI